MQLVVLGVLLSNHVTNLQMVLKVSASSQILKLISHYFAVQLRIQYFQALYHADYSLLYSH
jgi:hypothetical protein